MSPPRISAVIPTLGRSPLLADCLAALRRDAGAAVEIVVVDQGAEPAALPPGLADRVVRSGANRGFAGGTNLGLAAAGAPYLATVNDDALVQPGWAAALLAALEADPGAAAAQGVNLLLEPGRGEGEPERADGWGIAWNGVWQAVQLGHGGPALPPDGPVREVFGVSATAALYRRSALDAVALPAPGGPQAFDERLGSYYEDVDLAGRLLAAGWRALLVPAARALHAGSVTGRSLGRERLRRLYGNRILVAARLLGSGLWPRLPVLASRDLRDFAGALLRGEAGAALGIVEGWGRALRHLPGYARRGGTAVPLEALARFRALG